MAASMLGNIAANTTVYNSSEVDALLTAVNNKLTSAMHYKGTKANLAAIQAVTDKEVGDVYNADDTGDNYAWNGTGWDKLAGVVDLSAYVLDADLGALAKQDTVTMSQVDDLTDAIALCAKTADLGDLAGLDVVAEGNLATALATKINGKADTADLGDLAYKDVAAIGDVTGLQEALDAKADGGDLDEVAAKQAAVAGLTVPAKETITLYALYDLVKGIVDAMKD